MSNPNHKNKAGIISSFAISSVLIALSIFFVANKQYIVDQIAVWQYQPTSEVSDLVDRSGMNEAGKFVYLASRPKLDATQDFNAECDRVEFVTSILGCYSGSRIFVYDVTDSQLDGIREVTATHETLHAIYARMGDSEKQKINRLVEVEYKKLENDKDFAELMAFYSRTEPGQRDNELHSIIGTEVATIAPELETYYAKYFTDRQKVVSLNSKYSEVFKSLKLRADELLGQYNSLNASISSGLDRYNADVAAFNNDAISFKQRAESGGFSSQAQVNSEWYSLSARSSQLAATRAVLENDTKQRDSILAEYNSIASQSKKLYNVIDSSLAPAPSV